MTPKMRSELQCYLTDLPFAIGNHVSDPARPSGYRGKTTRGIQWPLADGGGRTLHVQTQIWWGDSVELEEDGCPETVE